jgi:acyloxyacyl hydrolase
MTTFLVTKSQCFCITTVDYPTLRGYHWRGADCNDQIEDIYPGRRASNYPDFIDHNCNGISGKDSSGNSYEDLFCKDTPPYGTIILGDSAGAHFHIPASWVTASEMNSTVYSDLLYIAENELDWPFMSSATGYMNISWEGVPVGPVDSGYLRVSILLYILML